MVSKPYHPSELPAYLKEAIANAEWRQEIALPPISRAEADAWIALLMRIKARPFIDLGNVECGVGSLGPEIFVPNGDSDA
jgi:hypothetical protein